LDRRGLEDTDESADTDCAPTAEGGRDLRPRLFSPAEADALMSSNLLRSVLGCDKSGVVTVDTVAVSADTDCAPTAEGGRDLRPRLFSPAEADDLISSNLLRSVFGSDKSGGVAMDSEPSACLSLGFSLLGD